MCCSSHTWCCPLLHVIKVTGPPAGILMAESQWAVNNPFVQQAAMCSLLLINAKDLSTS